MHTDVDPSRRVAVGPYTLELAVGDVAEAAGRFPVVSSDDNYLTHGGGVSAAIWRKVGDSLARDPAVQAVTEHGERPGLANVLVSRIGPELVPVFHAITIDFDLGERLSPRDLGLLYTNLLNTADEVGVEEMVLPLIGAEAAHVDAAGTVTALLDVVLSRSMLSRGQHISILAQEKALAESQDAFDRWAARHADSLTEDPASGKVPPPPRERATALRVGRWEHLARSQALASEVVSAARALDEATNVKASGPAMHLWALLDPDAHATSAHPREMRNVLEIARSARNRIAHGKGDQAALLPDLIRGIEVLLDPESAAGLGEDSAPVLVGGVRMDWSTDGTAHVRLLHDLLRTSLGPQEVDAESERLETLGYRGLPSDRLLENCVTDDPLDVLQRHFSGSTLRSLLEERGIPARPSDAPREMARKLLHHLGFPRRDELVDPEMVLRDVTILASELHSLSEPQLTGRIAGISRSLEAVLRTYMRFLTTGLLDKPPDVWLEERRRRKGPRGLPGSVDRATFGQLAVLVGAAGDQVSKSKDPHTQARVDDLRDESGVVKWLPDKIKQLVDQRNVWVHGAPEGTQLTVADNRRQAQEFCDLAQLILDALIAGPFPDVIVIEEVGYDTWGRRHVRARTSKGTVESIFTDLDLVPGQTYLMHARTNPLRVDPLLVRQAGAIEEEDL